MLEIHIRDNNFFSERYPERPNDFFKWIWDRGYVDSDITVFSDNYLREVESSNSRVKIAWLIEPPVISPFIYDYIAKSHNLFDMVFTFDERLIGLSPKIRYYPYGTTWIQGADRKLWDKIAKTSAIFSDKAYTDGHRLRHEIFNTFKDRVDFFGAMSGNRIENKADGLRDYAFSLVVENWTGNSYFSEKLLDSLLTGTIPIYYGFPKFLEFFDPNGFITFNNVNDLHDILPHLTMEQYRSRLDAVKANFEKALDFIDLERSLWGQGFKELLQ